MGSCLDKVYIVHSNLETIVGIKLQLENLEGAKHEIEKKNKEALEFCLNMGKRINDFNKALANEERRHEDTERTIRKLLHPELYQDLPVAKKKSVTQKD